MPTKKIYTNTIAQVAGKVTTALISIFLIKILTQFLEVSGYGLYSKIYNYLSIFAVMADLWLYTISVREMSQAQNNPEKLQKISGNILSLRTISGGIIIALSLIIALFLDGYNSPIALWSIAIVSIFTLFWLINSSLMSYLQAILKTEFSFVANTSGKILTFILVCLMAFVFLTNASLETKLLSVFLAGLAGNILMTTLTWWYASKFHKIRFYWDSDYILHILKISLPYGLALFLWVIFFKIDTLFLSIMEPENIADEIVGIYSLPMKIVEVWMMYGTIFLNSLLPVLTLAIEEKRHQDVCSLTSKWFELLMWFGAGISVFLAIFADKIIPFISSQDFVNNVVYGANAVDVMQIVAWIFLFYFVSSLANYILIAKNLQSKIIFLNLFVAIFNIIGNFLIIPHFHFIGSAIVTLVSQVFLLIMSLYLVRDTLEVGKILKKSLFLLFSALLAGFIAYEIDKIFTIESLFFALTLAGSIFGIIFLGMWFSSKKIKFLQ